jgi:hypothetical protein
MNCKKVWTRAHQNALLKPSFVNNQLRHQQEQVFYEREMALFPATIEIIEDRRTTNKLVSECRMNEMKLMAIHYNMLYCNSVIKENNRICGLLQTSPKMYSDYNANELNKQTQQMDEKHREATAEYEKASHHNMVIRNLLRMNSEERKIVMANYIEGANPEEILETIQQSGQYGDAIKRTRTQFIRACPIESCRGFLSQQWKCGLCNVFTCSKCNVPKCNVPKQKCNVPKQKCNVPKPTDQNTKINTNELTDAQDETETDENEHVCNPDDVATAELLAKDTKPCPQCGTGIFKIDGCDQMWCTECRTAFNWRTGNLETGHFHNPHYFEYQRRMGSDVRNILDMPCNALGPDQYHGILHHLIRQVMPKHKTDANVVKDKDARGKKHPLVKETTAHNIRERTTGYATSIHYFADRILPRYRPDAIQNNQELRVQYLTEQISLAEFKSALSRESKQFNRKIEIGQVIQTVVFGMSDILTRLVNFLREAYEHQQNQSSEQRHIVDENIILGMFSEIDALVEYANECLDFICKQYKLTRVALFVRDPITSQPVGLYTVKQIIQNTEEGPVTVLSRAKQI